VGLRSRFDEALATASGLITDDVRPRTLSRDLTGPVFNRRSSANRITPPRREFDKYWRLYQTTPIVRAPINQFADDVVSDGYRVEASSGAAQGFLDEWTDSCAVIAGERNRDLRELLRGIPIQTEVRGPALIEHAPAREDSEAIAGLTFVDPASITPFTQPGTNMLVRPGDTELNDIRLTDDGDAAAYVQHIDTGDERRLAQDDVTKLVSDPDVGDVFGVGSIEPVATRVEALREKMSDNEQAISSKAWGQWFIGFDPMTLKETDGSETLIEWDDDSMDDFMDELETIEPGDQVGHDGTIDVENIPGEVADILEYLKFDIDYILSALPAPKFVVGWETDINQFVSDAQERAHEQRVQAMRHRIERALTPVLCEVARQNGYSDAGVRLRLEPEDEVSPILSLSDEEIERIERYASAMSDLSGSADPATLVDDETLRTLILQLPEDSEADGVESLEIDPSEASELTDEQFRALVESRGSETGNGEAA
jgi:hypothetical protein